MSETNAEATETSAEATDQSKTGEGSTHDEQSGGPGTDEFKSEESKRAVLADLAKERDSRKEASRRAKQLEKELDELRTSSMSENEKAVAEAEKRGQQTATLEMGKRLARTEFDAIAARRNADVDTSQMLEFVDLAKFVGDDGEPDSKAIKSAVERLVPEPANGTPSYDGGSRTTAPAPVGMNGLIRKATGRA